MAGTWLLGDRIGQARHPSSSGAVLDGLAADLTAAGWVSMDAHTMDSQGGYQMPAQMMPGAPAGDEMRLGIPLTLVNTSGEVREFNFAREFSLVGGVTSGPVQLHSDTFGLLSRLNPGSAVNGVLYFDTTVPTATDPPLVLRWTRGGDTVDLAVPLGGAPDSQHPHGP